ncbi:EamA family transporter [Glutamicibacter sp. JL.03c]|uniref:DMT family transporter n=1 Tax=Glutamicibacter sp. JL.03c TaxID=2984842 RepID=UPI0021F6E2E0|nr:EamA family transporter [Glutamicibacter sp. JL.03c]UYQ77855.1 EamA family transporter [Glutamicibacter sp. JL.03c]
MAAQAPEVSPLAIGAASLGIGGLLQCLVGARSVWGSRYLLAKNKGMVFFGGVNVMIYPLAFYSSMSLGGVALGTVISLGTAPLFSGILERLADGARLTVRWYFAATLGILGSTLLGFSRATDSGSGGSEVVAGCLLGLVAGGSYACYSWATGRLLRTGIARQSAVGSVFGVGGLLLMPVLVATGGPLLSSTHNLMVATYLAVIPMFLGYLIFGMALAKVPASTATTVTLSEPAVAAALAVGLLNERLGIAGWSGMALIAVAVLILLVWSPRCGRVTCSVPTHQKSCSQGIRCGICQQDPSAVPAK